MAKVSALGSVGFSWLHHHAGLIFDESFFLDPLVRLDREARMRQVIAQRFPEDPLYPYEGCLVQLEGRRRPVALVGAIQPNLILAAAVGAQFVFYGDKDPDVTPAPLAGLSNLEPLWSIDWASTWPISLLLETVASARAELEPGMVIVPPFFWDTTGRATIHGLVTTAQKLMGERIFLEMADNPGFVTEFFAWIADAYIRLIHLFAEAARLEITSLHVGDCSLCMIGPGQFNDFVLPPLGELAGRVGPLRLHSCGHSDHLLPVFANVPRLATLNVGSGTSLAAIRQRFGDLRVDLIPDTELLTFNTPADVDRWVRARLAENAGGDLEFQYHLDLNQPEVNCLQISRTLRDLDIPCSRVEAF